MVLEGDTLRKREFPYDFKCLSQQGDFYSVFRASAMSAVSKKDNWSKIILMPDTCCKVANSAPQRVFLKHFKHVRLKSVIYA